MNPSYRHLIALFVDRTQIPVHRTHLQVLIWDKHASPVAIAALCVCLCGGALYEQAPLRRPKGYEPVVHNASVTPLAEAAKDDDPERAVQEGTTR